ncbi:baseplate J/gp47 family protein [Cohnella nanjingensis]|uniref:Baseplate J/gp47 family protein n=1 Tax=Cohnella nanjingensis TaxID=1387779 RepID=A0A7X0RN17_9BACL|nr:baseplate J/gp47 family protein [Cohnella nanjingensis]MBB6670288.1 baseplate J/gp47 family protein [Cohnella nanjingensis]
MYEGQTFDTILQRMLDRVPGDVDKREGSIIHDALAPAAAELAQMYAELDINYNLSFADTATGDFLSRITAQFGVNRKPATKARRKGAFFGSGNVPMNVPIGSRYGIDDLTYVVIDQISTGVFTLECETAGIVGNQKFGALLPIVNISGLSAANLTDVLVPGEDDETDDALRKRYYETVNEPAFGGNMADYKQKIGGIAGVGAVKITPAWSGGGTVLATIIASDWGVPSPALTNQVQTIIDPTVNSGLGYGFAPIGHTVTIAGVTDLIVNVETTLTLASGVTIGQVQADVRAAIDAYLLELRKDWANQVQLVVRVAQIEARILRVQGVDDVTGTTLNGSPANLTLTDAQIPKLGAVTTH